MILKTIASLSQEDLEGKKVLVRVDFNVPLDKHGNILDDKRIRESIPTIKDLINKKAVVILCSHLGRPKGEVNKKYSLFPVSVHLSKLLEIDVIWCDDCVGDEVEETIFKTKYGNVILLENLRFWEEEEAADPEFAYYLAELVDIYVNDAFATAHRNHSSCVGITDYILPCYAGYLMEKELLTLQASIENMKPKVALIIGGIKLSGKMRVIEDFLEICDKILVGGPLVYSFLKACGYNVGASRVADNLLEKASYIMEKAEALGVEFLLPSDVVVADKFSTDANYVTVKVEDMPENSIGMDIGTDSIAKFCHALSDCQTVIWNGTTGVFQFEQSAKGTIAIAHYLAKLTQNGATTIITGGSLGGAIKNICLDSQMTYISTGGGAALEFLVGKELPAIKALKVRHEYLL